MNRRFIALAAAAALVLAGCTEDNTKSADVSAKFSHGQWSSLPVEPTDVDLSLGQWIGDDVYALWKTSFTEDGSSFQDHPTGAKLSLTEKTWTDVTPGPSQLGASDVVYTKDAVIGTDIYSWTEKAPKASESEAEEEEEGIEPEPEGGYLAVYHTATNTWEELPELSQTGTLDGPYVVDGKLFFLTSGGFYLIDPASPKWELTSWPNAENVFSVADKAPAAFNLSATQMLALVELEKGETFEYELASIDTTDGTVKKISDVPEECLQDGTFSTSADGSVLADGPCVYTQETKKFTELVRPDTEPDEDAEWLASYYADDPAMADILYDQGSGLLYQVSKDKWWQSVALLKADTAVEPDEGSGDDEDAGDYAATINAVAGKILACDSTSCYTGNPGTLTDWLADVPPNSETSDEEAEEEDGDEEIIIDEDGNISIPEE
ncbi:MAG: hypothetical protein LBR21_00170 [Propionibacteriaceae bacterium]|jgi:hypothetical protein|nr:hypothetical protein [Propionibacteriaceae bacterium]